MSSYKVLITALAGALLVTSTFGVLIFGFDYSIFWVGETFAEIVGLLPTGWADDHVGWTLIAASVITAPILIAVFFLTKRQIARVETRLANDEGAGGPD